MAIDASLIHGAVELEYTDDGAMVVHRVPGWARRQADDPQLTMVESQPSGVRVVCDTTATRIALTALAHRFRYAGLAERPHGMFDVVVDGQPLAQGSLASAVTVTMDPATGGRHVDEAAAEELTWDLCPRA